MARLWMIIAGISGLTAVAAGAFAAHGLEERLVEAGLLSSFETGATYHLIHSLALIAVGWMASRGAPMANLAGICFVLGIVLFSGSLYLLLFNSSFVVVMATPAGGFLLMIGWILVALGALRDSELSATIAK